MPTQRETFYVSIKGGKVTVETLDGTERVVESKEEFLKLLADDTKAHGLDDSSITALFSSSMDFPEEHTEDPAVITLALQIRNE